MAVGVFLCGDVMTGRGVDQILAHPGDPRLSEHVVTDARTYVRLAEEANGPIPRPAACSWPWGEALSLLDEAAPDARVINLETTVTADGRFAPEKALHYRMNPANLAVLTVARPDVCVLANNHMLDFGLTGLADTLDALAGAGLRTVGAGRDAAEAVRPAVVEIHNCGGHGPPRPPQGASPQTPVFCGGHRPPRPPQGASPQTPSRHRVLVVAAGMPSSGVSRFSAATPARPGVAFVPDTSAASADALAASVTAHKRTGDVAIVSLHWGTNWGYTVDSGQVGFAHRLVESGVDIVHGHSAHHPRPIEIYRGGLILYGCGDLVNDYEGIGGYEAYRAELRLLYLADVDITGHERSVSLRMIPLRARAMRLERASAADAEWLRAALEHVSRHWGTRIGRGPDDTLATA
ncbi:CapA family protein [Amycolatopsis pigmentata]|uniref:CapA family protein n=1 Tax=Amycolatopsis pigmentata TaxID=450801 RepID=A0ABW5G514_9PSEU